MRGRIRKTNRPSRLGQWLNRLPEGQKWLWPVYASRRLRLVENVVESAALPAAFDGLRIAYASDIHYGAFLGDARADALADTLNALQADIVLLGGDYGDSSAQALAFFARMKPLRARLGVYGVVGNHDCFGAADGLSALLDAMERAGVTPLCNSAAHLTGGGARLTLCAVDDIYHGAPDYASVALQAKGADFCVFAPHSPDALPEAFDASPEPFFHFAVCGHTHGGQVTLFGLAPNTGSRYGFLYGMRHLRGMMEEHGAEILISNGVGASLLPVRVCAPAQCHLITLKGVSGRRQARRLP